MKIIQAAWVEHGGSPIYSVDVSPDELRFATAGMGNSIGRVTIWNIGPLLVEELETDENVPKVLGQLDYHNGCVNCVRWNSNGDYLASCSDDKTVMIFQNACKNTELRKNYLKNVDSWRLVGTLSGHKSDVIDLAWAPKKSWLSSGSVDNTVIIWDIEKLEKVMQLSEHKGLVKGVTWDPLGQYVASQSNDKTLRVFRTRDWKQEACFSRPFEITGDSTVVTRLDWSPDGQYIVCPNAFKAQSPTARIICVTRPFSEVEPSDENEEMDLIGHRKAVACVKFHPSLWRNKPGDKTHCIFATGSRDCTLAVWSSSLQRPIAILRRVFTASITDLGWSRCGQCLIACTPAGEFAAFHFKDGELGIMVNEVEQKQILENIYGDMALQSEKKRVVPIVQYADNLVDDEPMDIEKNGISEEKHEEAQVQEVSKSTLDTNVTENVMELDSKAVEIKSPEPQENVFNPPIESTPVVPLTSQSIPREQPQTENVFNPPIESTPIVPLPSPLIQVEQAPIENVVQRKQVVVRTADGKRRVTPISLPTNGPAAGAKIQVVIEERDAPTAEPVVVAKGSFSSQASIKPLPVSVPTMSTRPSPAIQVATTPATDYFVGSLDPINIRPGAIIRIEGEESDWLEIVGTGPIGVPTVKRRSRIKALIAEWEFVYSHAVTGVHSNRKMTAICCKDATLHFTDTKTGIPLLPPISLPGAAAYLTLVQERVLVVTTQGYLYVYGRQGIILSDTSLRNILFKERGKRVCVAFAKFSDAGFPVVILTNGQCLGWNKDLQSWLVLWDANSNVCRIGRELSSMISNKNLPLRSLTEMCGRFSSKPTLKSRSMSEPKCASNFLLQQMLAAQFLGSSVEFKFSLMALVRFHAEEGQIVELERLLHSIHDGTTGDLKLLGLSSKELIKDCIDSIKDLNSCERLCTEFNALLAL